MLIKDLRTLRPGSALSAGVCIVGSGPVGAALASELHEAGIDVIVLESGGRETDALADSLNAIESVGRARVMDQTLVRNRGVGGTTRTWSGRLAAFGETDFRERPWVPFSGWPISRAALLPYLSKALPHVGGTVADNGDPAFIASILRDESPRFDPDILQDYLWSYSRDPANPRDFARVGPRLEREAGGPTCLIHATVTEILLVEDGTSVSGVEVTGADGERREIAAGTVVLCAGGIENARLLLSSRRRHPAGIGNDRDQVGRYLMDHPRGPIATFAAKDGDALQRAFSSYRKTVGGAPTVLTRGISLPFSVQQRDQLLNCAAWVDSEGPADDDPFAAAIRVARLRGAPHRDAVLAARGAPRMAAGVLRFAAGRSPVRRIRNPHLACILEQAPDPSSRVTLSDRTDAFGLPLSRIDWKSSDAEKRTARAMHDAVASEFERLGLPKPRPSALLDDDGSPLDLPDVAHPMGTTRMSVDPARGVVDAECAVHGMRGLYAAGASTFPTGGHANPTLTAVALGLRLADHLIATLPSRRGVAAPARPVVDAAPGEVARATATSWDPRPLVLLTGASGKIGAKVMAALLARGYRVRALTSRLRRAAASDGVEWVVRDLRRDDLDFSEELQGCAAVVHLGAEMRHEAEMRRTNVEATGALARCAQTAGVAVICYASSVSVYGSGASPISPEDSTTLDPEVDDPAAYWGDSALRAYGRTKRGGELALIREADGIERVIFRLGVVVDEADMAQILTWNAARRTLLSHRRTQHVSVFDVADAFGWALDRAFARGCPEPVVSIFNVVDPKPDDSTFGKFFHEATTALGPRGPRSLVELPAIVDWSKDRLRYRHGLRWRRPLGMMRFPSDRLVQAGFGFPNGMASLRRSVIAASVDAAQADSQPVPRETEEISRSRHDG